MFHNCKILVQNGKTARHYAAWRGNLDIVKYLVENGANVNAKDEVRLDMHNITRVWTCCCDLSKNVKGLLQQKIASLYFLYILSVITCMLTNNNHVNCIATNTIVETAVVR